MLPENSGSNIYVYSPKIYCKGSSLRKFVDIWVAVFSHHTQPLLSNYNPQLFNSFSIFHFSLVFCAFSQQFETNFSQEKFGFHAGINKYQKYVTKKRREQTKKHSKRLKMSLKRISIPFLQILCTINFCTFRTFFKWKCAEKNVRTLDMQLPQCAQRKRGGSGAL